MKTEDIAAQWLTAQDVTSLLIEARRAKESFDAILQGMNAKVANRRQELNATLASMPVAQRLRAVDGSASTLEAELKASSADERKRRIRDLIAMSRRANAARPLYPGTVAMLMRADIGSERRSRCHDQLATSGPAEIAVLAKLACAADDRELAAAIVQRLHGMQAKARPVPASAIADHFFLDEWKRITVALVEIETLAKEALVAERHFLTGRSDTQGKVGVALARRKQAQVGVDLDELFDDQGVE